MNRILDSWNRHCALRTAINLGLNRWTLEVDSNKGHPSAVFPMLRETIFSCHAGRRVLEMAESACQSTGLAKDVLLNNLCNNVLPSNTSTRHDDVHLSSSQIAVSPYSILHSERALFGRKDGPRHSPRCCPQMIAQMQTNSVQKTRRCLIPFPLPLPPSLVLMTRQIPPSPPQTCFSLNNCST